MTICACCIGRSRRDAVNGPRKVHHGIIIEDNILTLSEAVRSQTEWYKISPDYTYSVQGSQGSYKVVQHDKEAKTTDYVD